MTINPKCPVLLVFAKQDSFDVIGNTIQLQNKENISIKILDAKHGFVDFYSKSYSLSEAEIFNQYRKSFTADCIRGGIPKEDRDPHPDLTKNRRRSCPYLWDN